MNMFTHRHYEAIAGAIKVGTVEGDSPFDYPQYAHENGRVEAACAIANVFANDNPRFDPHRFLRACDVDVDAWMPHDPT